MHPFSIIKIITASITVLIGVSCSIIEIRKNPTYWLNRFFALFFMSSSLGFFCYTLYHIILTNAQIVIPIMIISQTFFQLAMSFLLLTEWTLEYSEKTVITPKYILISSTLFILTSIGYAIVVPTLNTENYNQGFVDTDTPDGWFIFVFTYRILVLGFVLYKFIKLARESQGQVKVQIRYFSQGMLVNILATLITLLGGVEGILGVILETIGLVLFNVGVLLVLKGFLAKKDTPMEG